MGRLDDQSILISGAGSALGRALVERCLDEGARITVLDAHARQCRDLAADFRGAIGIVIDDVTRLAANRQAVSSAIARYGHLDGYVSCLTCWDHGLPLPALPAADLEAAYDAVFAVNVRALIAGAYAAAPELVKSGGSMVFTLSAEALAAGEGGALYTAARHAAAGLVRQLARDLAPGVRVNAVCTRILPVDRNEPELLARAARDAPARPARTPNGGPFMAPVMDFDPTRSVEPYVALLAKAHTPAPTGTFIRADGGPQVPGVLTLADLPPS